MQELNDALEIFLIDPINTFLCLLIGVKLTTIGIISIFKEILENFTKDIIILILGIIIFSFGITGLTI